MPGLIKILFPVIFLSLIFSVTPSLLLAEENSSYNEVFQNAMQLRNEGNFQQAELQFKRALELEPNNTDIRFELANLYALEHDDALSTKDTALADYYLKNASQELEQTMMIRPDYWSARFNLGVVYKKQGKFEASRTEFKKVIEQNPQVLAALMQIGETYELQGFYDEAESVYEDARDKGVPNDQILEAMRNLEMGRTQSHRSSESQMGQSLNGLSQKMNPNYLNHGDPNNSQGASLGTIGSALMQQFTQGRNQQKNN